MGLTTRKPAEQQSPDNIATIAPVARPTLVLIKGVGATESGESPARQTEEHGEEDTIRRRREAFLSANLPTQAAGWLGVGNKFFYQGKPAMTMDRDTIAIHDTAREVLVATIAIALRQGWEEITIDSKDPAVKQVLVELAREAGLRVSGVPAPGMKASESHATDTPGMR